MLEEKIILDCHGNPMKKNKLDKIKQKIKMNVWNILGVGLGACVTLGGLISIAMSNSYASLCADFYNVNKKYFSGTEVFEEKVVFLLAGLILFIYPFLFDYINRDMKSKLYVIVSFFALILILFVQNITHIANFIEYITYKPIKLIFDNWITVIIVLLSDIIIAYFFTIRNCFTKERKYNRFEKGILGTVLFILCFITSIGITTKMNYQISDKKEYEIVGSNKVIVSDFEGKFLIMECQIENNNLIIKKGKYWLAEMNELEITYREFDDVICE